MYNDALILLKKIYDFAQSHSFSSVAYSREELYNMKPEDRKYLEAVVDLLIQEGFLKPYAQCVGFPINVKITAAGIKKIEDVDESPSVEQTTYHIGTNNGIAGSNAQNNTFNYGHCSLEQYKKLVDDNVNSLQERKEILAEIENLFNAMNKNEPIQKGLLHKLKDYAWLSVPLAQTALTYIMSNL